MLNPDPAHAKELADDIVSKTLEELNHQQSKRLNALIVELLARQKEILGSIATQEMHVEFSTLAHTNTGLQDFLIEEKLINPSDALIRRKQSIEKHMTQSLHNLETTLRENANE